MSRLAANLRVIRALGVRAIKQTFRRPQLASPIIVFPTLLLAVQTGGAGRAVNLANFPRSTTSSASCSPGRCCSRACWPATSGGIALAVDLEMGFTDRLFAAPISRFAIVLGRLAGVAALAALGAVWFIAIGLIFGASFEQGVPGMLLMILLDRAGGGRVRRALRRDRALQRPGLGGPGPVPARLRDPLPVDRVLPGRPAARSRRRRSPTTTRSRSSSTAIREPVISSLTLSRSRRRSGRSRSSARSRSRSARWRCGIG